jgi:pimeloyl-ACP methyl ester carboxylesterase
LRGRGDREKDRLKAIGAAQMPSMMVNGTELHYEMRGGEPPVLLVMGATGDGGHFDAFAGLLADEFMVVSYDRRGNGRSPAPPGWQTTSPQEQGAGDRSRRGVRHEQRRELHVVPADPSSRNCAGRDIA